MSLWSWRRDRAAGMVVPRSAAMATAPSSRVFPSAARCVRAQVGERGRSSRRDCRLKEEQAMKRIELDFAGERG